MGAQYALSVDAFLWLILKYFSLDQILSVSELVDEQLHSS